MTIILEEEERQSERREKDGGGRCCVLQVKSMYVDDRVDLREPLKGLTRYYYVTQRMAREDDDFLFLKLLGRVSSCTGNRQIVN